MNFVKNLNLLNVEAKEIPCITGKGAPAETTEGAIGCFYMDTDTGLVYKCVNTNKWETVGLPKVANEDTGKFLRVSDAGVWEAQTVENGNEVAY